MYLNIGWMYMVMGKKLELKRYRRIHEPYVAYIDHEAKRGFVFEPEV